MTLYLQLFWEFFKTGLFAVGGGMATLPFLYDISNKTGWFTHAQLADMVAVSESTPGPIGVNMASYVGFVTGGVGGAVVATLGLIAPSILIVLIIAAFLKAFRDSKYVDGAFYGLRPASTALIASALVTVAKVAFFSSQNFGDLTAVLHGVEWKAVVLAAVLLLLTRYVPKVKSWHPIVFIGLSAAVGVIFRFAGA
ncbi:MAG: chromate transporter [Oscillospiraceae bacterium]|nr:chromate transporter [Oscillospiraceae bacterium]MDY5735922.1 chromate transporter [Oscillospiraceae bacterium]